MVKSDLATKVVDFEAKNSNPRQEKITKITIHHMAGNMGAVACAEMHRNGNQSANYYIGTDGTVCAGVSEDRRAWTSSSRWNDHRAITIEVANNTGAPSWTVSDAAYKSLIKLCVDICKRYKIVPHYDGTKNGTLTVHQMYDNTNCPGPYLLAKHNDGSIEKDINAEMQGTSNPSGKLYRVQVGAFRVKSNAEKLLKDLKSKGYDAFIAEVEG